MFLLKSKKKLVEDVEFFTIKGTFWSYIFDVYDGDTVTAVLNPFNGKKFNINKVGKNYYKFKFINALR